VQGTGLTLIYIANKESPHWYMEQFYGKIIRCIDKFYIRKA
jgi:hypothetical protein